MAGEFVLLSPRMVIQPFLVIFVQANNIYIMMKSLQNRTTIRRYKADDVSQELLNSLLEQAARTQTMGNLQLYSVVVTRDDKQKRRLAPAHFSQPMTTQAPVVLTICADFRRTTLWAEQRKAHPGYDNFLSFMNAATDALLFTQTFCCLAEEAGLGYCFLGTTIYNAEQIIDVLELPSLVIPVATITLGWPDEQPPLSDRLPLAAFVHDEVYRDYTPTKIDEYYAAKEELPVNKAFVAENKKETLAQVYTDVRYTKAANEAMSEALMKTLRKQGFV